jgi:hypothetical protein
VDDSDTSLRAIDWVARSQPPSAPCEVELLNVRSMPEQFGAVSVLDYGAVERALREGQQRVLATALEHAERAGLKQVTSHAAHGLPAEQIVEAAKVQGADQIVTWRRCRQPLANRRARARSRGIDCEVGGREVPT